jgi:hypothetical protein
MLTNLQREEEMKKLSIVLMTVAAVMCMVVVPAFSADKFIVKDSQQNTVFAVEDGTSNPDRIMRVIGGVPIMQNAGTAGFDFRNTGATYGASIQVGTSGNPNLYANFRGDTNVKDDSTKVSWGLRLDVVHDNFHVLRLPAGQPSGFADVFVINADGSITSSTGAVLTAGGTWQNASSRAYKENITPLSTKEAINTLEGLNPVKYNYKVDKNEKHVGFIAEDVPDLVAAKNRKSLSSLDIVAVLTKVVQEQQEAIAAKSRIVDSQQKTLAELEKTVSNMSEKLERMERMLNLKGSVALNAN